MKTFLQMINPKVIIFSVATIVLVVALLLAVAPEASAQIDSIRQGVGSTGDAPEGDAETTILDTVETAINIFSIIIGVISVIMIIIGGLKYITSTGDSSKVESAKNTIIYAVVGLVIVALAQVIVFYVLDRVEGGPSDDGSNGDSSSASSLVVSVGESSYR